MTPTCGARVLTALLPLLSVALVASLLTSPAVAQAPLSLEEEQAREHFRMGTADYQNGRFPSAAQHFRDAYRLSPRPTLLYNVYLACRDGGDLDCAVESLGTYLELDADAPNRPHLEARLTVLRQSLERQTTPPPETAPDPNQALRGAAEQETSGEGAPDRPAGERRSRALPLSLLGGGLALGGASVVTGVMTRSALNELERECSADLCDPNLRSRRDRGRALAITTDVLWASGAAVAITGLVLLLVGRDRGDAPTQPVADCNAMGCTFGARGSF